MNKRAAAAVIGAGIFWGTISIFIRRLSAGGLDTLQIGGLRLLFAAVLFTGFALCRDPGCLRIRPRDIWCFVGTGIVSIVVFNLLYFYTVISSQASVAVVLLYTSPVFVMLLSLIIFGERITRPKLIALCLTDGGCVLVAGLAGGSVSVMPLTVLTGVGSGLFYALYTIFARFALKRYRSMTVTVWTFLFALAGVIPVGRFPETVRVLAADPVLLLWAAGLGICNTAIPYFLYTWGLERMESGRAAILVAVEPLVGALIGVLLFREEMTLTKGLGILLIVASVILLNLPPKSVRPPEDP